MKQKQKPLSFSLNPLNIEYIESVVSKQKEVNSRYSRSMYMDDLITHLRTKAEAKPKTEIAVVKKPVKKFTPPTFADVDEYMRTRMCPDPITQAEKFCDFYESKGWVVGKVKMKCWKAAVRNWLKGSSKAETKQIEHSNQLNDTSWANNLDDVL